ncbi:uncharacterized protein LOC125178495 [Hyalella azteca]|uniref:XK-related protein n=1 Tax=Hyalella azteca TaxID=294128 RepID=A0A979FNJ5_HYAAZ|nr:uncharacterized protein LOC125178495 [Hyalella azteca]
MSGLPASQLVGLVVTVCSAAVLAADLASDTVTCVLLFLAGRTSWAAVTAVWPLLAVVVTVILNGPTVPDTPSDSHVNANKKTSENSTRSSKNQASNLKQSQNEAINECKRIDARNGKTYQENFNNQQQLQQEHESGIEENVASNHQTSDNNGQEQFSDNDREEANDSDRGRPDDSGLARSAKQQRFIGGTLHRYISLFALQLRREAGEKHIAAAEHSAALVHLLQAALQSAPQLLLQLYGVLHLQHQQPYIIVCAVTSLTNLLWIVGNFAFYPSILPVRHSEDSVPKTGKSTDNRRISSGVQSDGLSSMREQKSTQNSLNVSNSLHPIRKDQDIFSNHTKVSNVQNNTENSIVNSEQKNFTEGEIKTSGGSSNRNSRICHSRSDSGLDNSYRGSQSLPKFLDSNNDHQNGSKFFSLPSNSGYQPMQLGSVCVSSGLLDVPLKPIKTHKFGSVITLKERSLMTSNSHNNVHCVNNKALRDSGNHLTATLVSAVAALSAVLLLAARLAALTVTALMIGPWLYMTACVHVTVMFVMVVSERPGFSDVLWRDVVMSLTTATAYCITVIPLSTKTTTWRKVVCFAILSLEDLSAVTAFFFLPGHYCAQYKLLVLLLVSVLSLVGLSLQLLSKIILRRQNKRRPRDLELGTCPPGGCLPGSCLSYPKVAATLALPEDTSDDFSGVSDSNYGSSSPAPSTDNNDGCVPLERQTGLLCSVQDLLANMSCLNEDLQLDESTGEGVHELEGNTRGTKWSSRRQDCVTESEDPNLRSTWKTQNETWNSKRPLSTVGNLSCQSRSTSSRMNGVSKFATVFHTRSFNRDCSSHAPVQTGSLSSVAFKTNADYENYPQGDFQCTEYKESGEIPAIATYSPSSLERSVTREFDDRIQVLQDATHDVSSLANSSSGSCCTTPGTGLLRQVSAAEGYRHNNQLQHRKNNSSSSILRAVDAEHDLISASETEMKLISIPQTSPSSLYSSLNNSESTECDTAIEMKQTSFHRPALCHVEYSTVRKLPSIRKSRNGKHDYENVYDDMRVEENSPEQNCLNALNENFANETGNCGSEICIQSAEEAERGRNCMMTDLSQACGTNHISSQSGNEKKCHQNHNLQAVPTSTKISALPLPLPPRTYIIRYPYQYFPLPAIKVPDVGNQSTNSSNHDYENLPPMNVNRGLFGVRHWKAYLDIEDRTHDYSTFKEKSKINSTASSSLTSDCSELKNVSSGRTRKSLVDDSESVLSRSLPDLSNLVLEACIEVPPEENQEIGNDKKALDKLPDNVRLISVLNTLRATKVLRTNSVDDLSNYETIWLDDIDETLKAEKQASDTSNNTEHSSLITTIGDVKTKGSLCNLYYSTMSDLSRRFYSETLLRQNSSRLQTSLCGVSRGAPMEVVHLGIMDRISSRSSVRSQRAQGLQGIAELVEPTDVNFDKKAADDLPKTPTPELNLDFDYKNINGFTAPQNLNTSVNINEGLENRPRRKLSMIREKFEGQRWTSLKSPLKFHSPAKAIQAGLRVFNRPRVHIITPSDEDEVETFGDKLKSPFKSKPKIVSTPPPTCVGKDDNNTYAKPFEDASNLTQLRSKKITPNSRLLTSSQSCFSSVSVAQETPLPNSVRSVQKTPKTSTPDNARNKKNNRCESSIDSSKCDSLVASAPKHSTPEGIAHHLPQLSAISGLSSVVESPELSRINSTYGPLPRTYSSARGVEGAMRRLPLSENVRRGGDRVDNYGRKISFNDTDRKSEVIPVNFNDCGIGKRSQLSRKDSHTMFKENNYDPQNITRVKASPHNNYLGFHGQQETSYSKMPMLYPRISEAYRDNNIFIAPLPVATYGINNQKSTLTPNSKIFDRKI